MWCTPRGFASYRIYYKDVFQTNQLQLKINRRFSDSSILEVQHKTGTESTKRVHERDLVAHQD